MEEKNKELKTLIAPILESILDDSFEDNELQSVSFVALLAGIATSVIANLTSESIKVCYRRYVQNVKTKIDETGLQLSEANSESLFITSYNYLHNSHIGHEEWTILYNDDTDMTISSS